MWKWCCVNSTKMNDNCCDTVTKIQSYEGHESISCPYESQYQNSLKYICRGTRPSTCLQQALITSDTKSNGRFTLDDDKVLGTFTVTINNLTQNDSGSYLCGIHRNSELDIFTLVELEVQATNLYVNYAYKATHQCIVGCAIMVWGLISAVVLEILSKLPLKVFLFVCLFVCCVFRFRISKDVLHITCLKLWSCCFKIKCQKSPSTKKMI
uniref:Immunoglobulin V-set domain-containing protein n=1 Tax=Maylandia zebra TaxID=106582 RepID=A0A3P9BGT4_9CICH